MVPGLNLSTYITAASILAWIAVAHVGLVLAVDASEAGLAGASVAPLACVCAFGIILAGFMIGAEVKVFVAKQAAPSFLTVALKRFFACSMQAARVAHALIAEGALPPEATRALTRGITMTMGFTAARRADGC